MRRPHLAVITLMLLVIRSDPIPPSPLLPSWEVNCDNEVAWDGYIVPDFDDYCVPGLLSQDALNAQFPRDFYGVMSSYGPYAMDLMEDRAGVRRGHGVALTTCGMMGYTVWLRIPGENWRGPFTVVDCGAPAHTFYQIAEQGLAVEIGYLAAQTWVPAAPRVDVRIGPRSGAWDGVYLARWWVGEYPFAICGSHAREISEALE